MLEKLFGDPNKKYLKKIQPIVEEINGLEKKFESFSDIDLKNKTKEFKEVLNPSTSLRASKALDDILPEAFAAVRESAKRTLNQRHYDVQLIGGIVLHQGKIAEMKTGEGKTLASTLAVYLNALIGKGVHVVTVNDYLSKRDAVWMGQIYYALGMSVACINHDSAYIYDPDYTQEHKNSKDQETNNKQIQNSNNLNSKLDEKRDEMGGFKVFEDYLRPCERREAYQCDILYGTNNEFGFDYLRDNMAQDKRQIVQREHNFAIVDEVDSILIDEARTPLIISAPDAESGKMYQQFAKIVPRLKNEEDYKIEEKSRAVTLTNSGIDKVEKTLGMENIYQEKGIQIIHHLEQALRAEVLFKRDKDYVVKPASPAGGGGEIIIVDDFTGRLMPGRRYSGGLHQAIEAKEGVEVKRESKTLASITFQNFFRMYDKLAGMTGTALTSAEEFDKVYKLHVIAIPTNKEIIRKDYSDLVFKNEAGKFKAVIEKIKQANKKQQPVLVGTVSIEKNELLGTLLKREGIQHNLLNAKNHEKEGEIIAQAGRAGAVTIATNMAGRGVDIVLGGNPVDPENAKKVKEAGGLLVVGTERHEARRIDNQLRGRSGRQGDPGESQFFVSLEDELMRRFGSDRIKTIMDTLKIPDDQPIQNKLISDAIGKAQSRIEGYNFDIRNHVLEYDEVLNKQRDVIYKKRKEILFSSDKKIQEIIKELMEEKEWKEYKQRVEKMGEDFEKAGRFIILRAIDMFWMEHLETMDCLKQSVGLRAYGQRDPLIEYKNESRRLFDVLLQNIDNMIVDMLLKAEITRQQHQQAGLQGGQEARSVKRSEGKKIGRNDPCPCGAKHPDGRPKKYKHCCGK